MRHLSRTHHVVVQSKNSAGDDENEKFAGEHRRLNHHHHHQFSSPDSYQQRASSGQSRAFIPSPRNHCLRRLRSKTISSFFTAWALKPESFNRPMTSSHPKLQATTSPKEFRPKPCAETTPPLHQSRMVPWENANHRSLSRLYSVEETTVYQSPCPPAREMSHRRSREPPQLTLTHRFSRKRGEKESTILGRHRHRHLIRSTFFGPNLCIHIVVTSWTILKARSSRIKNKKRNLKRVQKFAKKHYILPIIRLLSHSSKRLWLHHLIAQT